TTGATEKLRALRRAHEGRLKLRSEDVFLRFEQAARGAAAGVIREGGDHTGVGEAVLLEMVGADVELGFADSVFDAKEFDPEALDEGRSEKHFGGRHGSDAHGKQFSTKCGFGV